MPNFSPYTLTILTDPSITDADKETIHKLLSRDPVDALASLDVVAGAVRDTIRMRCPELF